MSKIGHFSEHWRDDKGRPAGGVSSGRGFAISWQNGPLGRGNERRDPNGAFVTSGDPRTIPEHVYRWRDGSKVVLCDHCARTMLNAATPGALRRVNDRISARCKFAGWEHI